MKKKPLLFTDQIKFLIYSEVDIVSKLHYNLIAAIVQYERY